MRNGITAIAALATTLLTAMPGYTQGILEQMQDEVAGIVNRARPAIVSIEDERVFGAPRGRAQEDGKPGRDGGRTQSATGFPRRPPGEPPKVGSGFSIGDGYIVTTADVLSGMKNPMVLTEDGRRIHATISGIDAEMNIGVIKLMSKTSLPGLKLGRSSLLYPGHFAISIGNQYGHVNAVALTLVAGIRDDGVPGGEHFYPGLIQIAGTVGVGTSGAPILNVRGEVVGMIAGIPFGDWTMSAFPNARPGAGAIPGPPPGVGPPHGVADVALPGSQAGQDPAAPGAGNNGDPVKPDSRVVYMRPPVTSAGFAVPIDDMKPVLAGLRQGKLIHCWLGVDMKEKREKEESDGIVTWKRSVFVSTVYPNSPASAAGFQTGDILSSVNGRSIGRVANVRAALLRAQPGDAMEVRVERKGVRQTVNARLVARPDAAPAPGGSGKH